MRILVTGARGMLGVDLVCILEEKGHEVFATDIQELDITKKPSLKKTVRDILPDALINCAAYTDVDRAEKEPDKAFLINGIGVRNLARVCRDLGVALCHISTDYVFSGEKEGAYTPEDAPDPVNTYGLTKWAGEKFIQWTMERYLIVRTSWLYGKYGRNFVTKILDLAGKQKEIRVVDDQVGSPTWTVTLARALSKLVETGRCGIYHVTDRTDKGISWYTFAREIVRLSGGDAQVIPVKTEAFPLPARRPENSLLDVRGAEATMEEKLPSWNRALQKFLGSFDFNRFPNYS